MTVDYNNSLEFESAIKEIMRSKVITLFSVGRGMWLGGRSGQLSVRKLPVPGLGVFLEKTLFATVFTGFSVFVLKKTCCIN